MLILYSDIERKSSPTYNIEKKHHFGSFHQVNVQFDGAESIVCLRLIVCIMSVPAWSYNTEQE